MIITLTVYFQESELVIIVPLWQKARHAILSEHNDPPLSPPPPPLCVHVHTACVCVHDGLPGNKLIGHMPAQMSSLFNKAGDLNCHYCQHLTMVLPARWYLVIYHGDERSQFTLYSIHGKFI